MIATAPEPKDVREAIRLKSANCWGALSMANALGGTQTPAWTLAHHHTLADLIQHANENGIDLDDLQAAVDETPVKESLYFRRAAGALSEAEFQKLFAQWQRGGK